MLVLAANKSDLLDTIPSDHMAMKEKDRQRLQQLCENGAALFKQATAYAATIGASLFKTSAKSGAGMMICVVLLFSININKKPPGPCYYSPPSTGYCMWEHYTRRVLTTISSYALFECFVLCRGRRYVYVFISKVVGKST